MQKTNRDLADEIRSAYLTDTHWRRNADRLIRSLLTTDEEDEMTCQECEAVLPEYLLAEREGTSNLARWRSVALHLTLCPHCANELSETSELMALGLGSAVSSPCTLLRRTCPSCASSERKQRNRRPISGILTKWVS